MSLHVGTDLSHGLVAGITNAIAAPFPLSSFPSSSSPCHATTTVKRLSEEVRRVRVKEEIQRAVATAGRLRERGADFHLLDDGYTALALCMPADGRAGRKGRRAGTRERTEKEGHG